MSKRGEDPAKAFGGSEIRGRTAQHGTQSGYVVHRTYGQQACAECKKAHSVYVQAQKARRLGAKIDLPPASKGELS